VVPSHERRVKRKSLPGELFAEFLQNSRLLGAFERSVATAEPVGSGFTLAILVDDDPARISTLSVVVVLAALAPTLQIDG
jgi:hypothetical protein